MLLENKKLHVDIMDDQEEHINYEEIDLKDSGESITQRIEKTTMNVTIVGVSV